MGPKKKKKGGKGKKGGGDPSALNDDLDVARLRMQNEELRVLLSFERADKKKVRLEWNRERDVGTNELRAFLLYKLAACSQHTPHPRAKPAVPD